MSERRGLDYYGLLGLTPSAGVQDIKKAYRRLGLAYNPERQNDPKLAPLFSLIGEAYEVLSTPLLRALYDQYGEEGMKKGVLTPHGWFPPYIYHGDPLKTFKEFYGTTNPFADLLDTLHTPIPLFSTTEGKDTKKKEPPTVKPLYLSLEEIYHGTVKKVKIERRVFATDSQDETKIQECIFTIPIKAGLPAGTVLTFPDAGDMGPSIIPGDIEFVIHEKEHDRFKRNGTDLNIEMTISLSEALSGPTFSVKTLDDRVLQVAVTDIVRPGYTYALPEEGMPCVKDPKIKGDLVIHFQILFPEYLPKRNKKIIAKLLKDTAIPLCSPEGINRAEVKDKMSRTIRDKKKIRAKKNPAVLQY